MKQNKLLYNSLLQLYNKCKRQLSNLIATGRNTNPQSVLQKHIEKLCTKQMQLHASIQHSTAIASIALASMAFNGNDAQAQITFSTTVVNPFGLTAIGFNTYASPTFADLDNDGDLDMLAGQLNGSFNFYVNTGSSTAPSYSAGVNNPYGLSSLPSNSAPAFVDLDNDGDMDIMAGSYNGDFYYLKNTGTSSAPSYSASVLNTFGLVGTGLTSTNYAPAFVDLDGDGDLDMMAGAGGSTLKYFKNNGTVSAPAFLAPISNPFGLAPISDYLTPSFFDLDGDGDKDLMCGRNDGSYNYFQNTGSVSAPSFAANAVNPFSLSTYLAYQTAVKFVDLNADGLVDLFVGDRNGNFYFRKNITAKGEALNFDGVNDYVNCGNSLSSVLNTLNTISVEAWVKPTDVAYYGTIVGNYNSIAGSLQVILVQGANDYLFYVDDGTGTKIVTAANTVTASVWQHVVGVWNGSDLKLYVNGVLSATSGGVNGPHLATNSNPIWIGGDNGLNNFTGDIDEVRIWSKALCAADISNSKNAEIPTTASNLLANYHFNQGLVGIANPASTILPNAVGSTSTGTLTGFALTGTVSNWVAPGAVVSGSTVTPLVSPTITISGGASAICNGGSTTYTASGSVVSYTWSSGPTTSTCSVSPSVTTVYSVVGTNAIGCPTSRATVTLNVNPSPNISVNSGSICAGKSYTMIPTGASTYTFSGGSSVVSPTANASYSVTGTSTAGCVSSSPAVSLITVNAVPVITAPSATICSGSSVMLTVSGAYTFTWSTGDNTWFTYVYPTVNTSYTVNGTSYEGCAGIPVITNVTVNSGSIAVNSPSLCAGNTVTLTASGVTTYTWSNGSHASSIVITPTANVTYTVSGDLTGCLASSTNVSTVTVNSLPTITAIASPTNAAVCSGSNLTLSGSGALTYTWSSGVINNTAFIPSSSGTYTVTGTDLHGCASNTTIAVTVNTLPTVLANSSNTLTCVGQPVVLTASGASSYIWNTSATTSTISVSPVTTTVYTVTGTDANGCIKTTTVTQNVNTCTSIESLNENKDAMFIVYPNPTNGVINIDLMNETSEATQFQLLNVLGDIVITETTNSQHVTINMSALSNGVYFLKTSQNGTFKTVRVIKN